MRTEYWGPNELCTVRERGLRVTSAHNGTAPDIIYWYLGSPIIRLLVKLITPFADALCYATRVDTAGDWSESRTVGTFAFNEEFARDFGFWVRNMTPIQNG